MPQPIPNFTVQQELLESARPVLSRLSRACWIIGGAAAGKSTICQFLSQRTGITVIDVDARIYGGFSYSAQRHPANSTWLGAPNPLDWALSLSAEAFDAFNRATTAEYLDLLAADLADQDPFEPLLIDGGITHPALAAQVMTPERLLCIVTADADRIDAWETAADRAPMRDWIAQLADPEDKWQVFLRFDRLIAHTMARESREQGIKMVQRDQDLSVDALAAVIADHFQI